MSVVKCTDCGTKQDVPIDITTYSLICEACGTTFDVPRQNRVNKPELQEHKSSVNIRVGYSEVGSELAVGWTVQSAEKRNQYLEKDSALVDVSNHPQKLHWYISVFKCLQNIEDYKSARIWVKDRNVLDHLSGKSDLPETDVREGMKKRIVCMASEKFYGCEFGKTSNIGNDIRTMVGAYQ